MPSEDEKAEEVRVMNTLTAFVRILVKEYPLVFRNGTGNVKVNPSVQPPFPYEVSLRIWKKLPPQSQT